MITPQIFGSSRGYGDLMFHNLAQRAFSGNGTFGGRPRQYKPPASAAPTYNEAGGRLEYPDQNQGQIQAVNANAAAASKAVPYQGGGPSFDMLSGLISALQRGQLSAAQIIPYFNAARGGGQFGPTRYNYGESSGGGGPYEGGDFDWNQRMGGLMLPSWSGMSGWGNGGWFGSGQQLWRPQFWQHQPKPAAAPMPQQTTDEQVAAPQPTAARPRQTGGGARY